MDRLGKTILWVKADPIFAGLKQILNEPESRIFLGDSPPNYKHDHKVISKISVPTSNGWFADRFSLELNRDLITIIGGRGSGKSALAEAIAYGAGSKDDSDDAFFKKAAKHKSSITGTKIHLDWADSATKTEFEVGKLDLDKGLVRYLPQGAVEELCSPQNSEKLRKQIENVIFQALDETHRMGASDFDELQNRVLGEFQFEKDQITGSITELNSKISNILKLLKNLPEKEKQLGDKKEELGKLLKSLPELPPQDKKGQEELSKLLEAKKKFETKIVEFQTKLTKISEIETKVKIFKVKAKEFRDEIGVLLLDIQISETQPFDVAVDEAGIKVLLEKKKTEIASQIKTLREGEKKDVAAILGIPVGEIVFNNLQVLNQGIDDKQKETKAFETTKLKYQQQKKMALDLENSIKALESEIKKIRAESLPEKKRLETDRIKVYSSYFDLIKNEKAKIEQLYKPLQESLLAGTDTDKKLVFEAQINYRLSHHIKSGLELIDRTRKGNFRESNSLKKILNEMAENFSRGDYEKKVIDGQLAIVLNAFVTFEATSIQIEEQLRENKSLEDFYNWLFDPTYFEIISSLKFDDTDLYLLSPGQKGIILLMLYLEIDKADYRPLIIDQPEENLDNLSVYTDLIDYFRDRKQYRQIIMVTHNPNLVVNTDSEQIIVANYQGKRTPRLDYCSGSLEDQAKAIPDVQVEKFEDGIIEQVCSILEGGEPAFESRKKKYQISIKSQIK